MLLTVPVLVYQGSEGSPLLLAATLTPRSEAGLSPLLLALAALLTPRSEARLSTLLLALAALTRRSEARLSPLLPAPGVCAHAGDGNGLSWESRRLPYNTGMLQQ